MMSELGPIISEHTENQTATGSTLFVGLICFGLAVLMTIFVIGEEGITFNQFLFGFGGLAALAGGICSVQSFLKNRGGKVEIYQDGLIAEKGGRRHVARWNEIAALTESIEKMYLKGSYIYDRYLYTIEKTNGETFTLSNMVSDIAGIGGILKTKTLELLLPQAKEKIRRGEKVLFDTLAVDQNGLSGKLWTELSLLTLKDGSIDIVDKTGKTVFTGSFAATPNAHLLIELLKERIPRTEIGTRQN